MIAVPRMAFGLCLEEHECSYARRKGKERWSLCFIFITSINCHSTKCWISWFIVSFFVCFIVPRSLSWITLEGDWPLTRIEWGAFSSSLLQSMILPWNVWSMDGSAFADVKSDSIPIKGQNTIFYYTNWFACSQGDTTGQRHDDLVLLSEFFRRFDFLEARNRFTKAAPSNRVAPILHDSPFSFTDKLVSAEAFHETKNVFSFMPDSEHVMIGIMNGRLWELTAKAFIEWSCILDWLHLQSNLFEQPASRHVNQFQIWFYWSSQWTGSNHCSTTMRMKSPKELGRVLGNI
jgi:hypothetical protein